MDENTPIRLAVRALRAEFIGACKAGTYGRVEQMHPERLINRAVQEIRREFLEFCDACETLADAEEARRVFIADVPSRTEYCRAYQARGYPVGAARAKCLHYWQLYRSMRQKLLTDRAHLPVLVVRPDGHYSRRLDGTHRISILCHLGIESAPILVVTEEEYADYARKNLPRTLVAEQIRRFPKWYQGIEVLPGLWTRPERADKEGLMVQVLRGLAWDRSKSSVLDVGCNDGLYTLEAQIAGAWHVLGVDKRPETIEQAELVKQVWGVTRPPAFKVTFEAANILERPDLLAGSAGPDTLICACVLYHLADGFWPFLQAVRESGIKRVICQGNLGRRAKCPPEELAALEREGVVPEKTSARVIYDVPAFAAVFQPAGFRLTARHDGTYPICILQRK